MVQLDLTIQNKNASQKYSGLEKELVVGSEEKEYILKFIKLIIEFKRFYRIIKYPTRRNLAVCIRVQ